MRKNDQPQGIIKDGRPCFEISCLYSTPDMTEVGMVSILVAKQGKRHTWGRDCHLLSRHKYSSTSLCNVL